MKTRALFSFVLVAAVACGGGEPEPADSGAGGGSQPPAAAPAAPTLARPTGPMTTPDWFATRITGHSHYQRCTEGTTNRGGLIVATTSGEGKAT